MAPQTNIPPAANVLGTIGTAFGAYRFLVPQVWHNWRRKDTEGLPSLMVFLWSAAGVPLGVYAIVQNFNLPLQIQPHMCCSFALICWGQVFVYSKKWRVWTATLLVIGTGAAFAAVELVLVFTLRGPYSRGVEWPILMIGVIAAIFVAAGLIPAYFELAKRQGRVIGINFIFLGMDWAGAFFSLMALVAQNSFDILGGVSYIGCILLETGIFMSHVIWLFRTPRIHKLAKLAGQTYDEYVSSTEKAMSGQTHTGTPSPRAVEPKSSVIQSVDDSPC